MNKYLAATLIVLLLAGAAFSQAPEEITEDFVLDIKLPGDRIPENLTVPLYVVYGSEMDFLERLVLDSILSNQTDLSPKATHGNSTRDIKTETIIYVDSEADIETLGEGPSLVVFLGDRNNLTQEAYSQGMVEIEKEEYMGQLRIGKGQIDADSGLIVIYHPSDEKLERSAAKYSPLKGLMPEEYVPLAAAGIGMFLLGAFNIVQELIEALIEDFGKKEKKIEYDKKTHLRELLAIIAASLVLGLSITWTYAAFDAGFFDLLALNAGICLLAVLSHEVSHRVVGRLLGIEMQYRFWLRGSAITMFTAFLGNSFGVPGFLMEKEDENISKWKMAMAKIVGPVFSLTLTLAFAYLFLRDPQPIYQMTYATASILAMAEILPTKRVDGGDIKDWNRLVWLILFVMISGAYIFFNFF